jgi:hypothetical protein
MHPTHKNLTFGWWSLLCWLAFGLFLEVMHGFKVGWYLDVANEARRLQLSLAHTHGTLIAVVNLVFAVGFQATTPPLGRLPAAAVCLRWAGITMPVGFLLGGLFPLGPDPGFAVVLVPIGGLLLFAGVLQAALALPGARGAASMPAGPPPPSGRPEPKPGKGKKQGA